MSKYLFTLLAVFLLNVAFGQSSKWMLYPSLGIDMGGAIPLPLSMIPDGSKGTPRITPSLGLGLRFNINNKWNLEAEANYHVLSFTANATVISQPFYFDDKTNVLYFSGETHTDCELRFVELPLSVYYSLNDNWSLIFGGYYSFILEGKFETAGKNGWMSDDKEITDNTPLPGTVSTQYNFNDELDSFDAGLLIGYEYRITPRVLFWGRFHFGFKSIFNPEFENIDYEMYQMRLNTGISYVLFRTND